MHVSPHVLANQASLAAATVPPTPKKGGSALSNRAGGRSGAQNDADASAAQIKPNGLYFALKSSVSRKPSDATEDDSSAADSDSSSAKGDVTASQEEDSAAKSVDSNPETLAGRLYTARGDLSAAPSVAGSVFVATV